MKTPRLILKAGWLILMLSVLIFTGYNPARAMDVVVSIKPLHSIVAGVMKGVGEPKLLIPGNASPHGMVLKPSLASALQKAGLVVWVGPSLEAALAKPIATLSSRARVIEAAKIPGLTLYKFRSQEPAHDADHDDGHDGHDHTGTDPHLWLDPDNAALIAQSVAQTLIKIDPAHSEQYRANLAATHARLKTLDAELQQIMTPLRKRSYITFHDGYQYFERHFGLISGGVVALNPERQPGAAHIYNLRAKIKKEAIVCLFTEPQFSSRLVSTLRDGTSVKTGVLDPMGGTIPAGSENYFAMMRANAMAMKTCLE